MIARILITIAMVSLFAPVALANDIFFDQTDEAGGTTAGITALIVTQSGTADNQIGTSSRSTLFEGALDSVVIKQVNSVFATGANTADILFYGNDLASGHTFSATFDGSDNDFGFTLGSASDTITSNFYSDVDYALDIKGDGNKITDTLANSDTPSATLWYNGTILGNHNTIKSSSTGADIGTVAIDYAITGEHNTLAVFMSNVAGNRNIDFVLKGTGGANDNVWNLNAEASTLSLIDVSQDGAYSYDVMGTIMQIGTSGQFLMDLHKEGMGTFDVSATATSTNAYANIDLTALGAGSFTINQTAPNAYFSGAITVAAGRAVVVSQ